MHGGIARRSPQEPDAQLFRMHGVLTAQRGAHVSSTAGARAALSCAQTRRHPPHPHIHCTAEGWLPLHRFQPDKQVKDGSAGKNGLAFGRFRDRVLPFKKRTVHRHRAAMRNKRVAPVDPCRHPRRREGSAKHLAIRREVAR